MNLCTTAFFKGEGKPWKLASVREGVCYIGLVFKQDPTGDGRANACCGAQMFLDFRRWRGFPRRDGTLRWSPDRKEYHLSQEAAEQLARVVSRITPGSMGRHRESCSSMDVPHSTTRNGTAFVPPCLRTTNLVGVRIRRTSDLKLVSTRDCSDHARSCLQIDSVPRLSMEHRLRAKIRHISRMGNAQPNSRRNCARRGAN